VTASHIRQYELGLQREIALERAETILSESPPALREKIDWIRTTVEEEWRRSIVSRYQIAAAIKEVYDDVNDNNGSVYGARAVEAVKKALGWDDGVIYQALRVADAFTPEQIDDMARMRTAGGRPLSVSHVVALAGVEDEGRRRKLLDRTVKEGWTARRLVNAAALPCGAESGAARERRGRPLARPKDFDAALDQQAHFAQDFLDRDGQVWSRPEHSLAAKARELDTADFTRERAERLRRHAKQMNLLARKAKERADEAAGVRALFARVLKEQAAGHKKAGLTATPGAASAPA
jgi:hypothetical protein